MRTPAKLFDIALDLLYPPKCPFCRKLLKEKEVGACGKCKRHLPYADGVMENPASQFSKCVSAFIYEGVVRDAIHRFKFTDTPGHGPGFGKLMAQYAHENLSGEYDVITYVPISRKRYKERGYDQAQILAKETAKNLDLKVTSTLQKSNDNKAQSSTTSRKERLENVRNVYIAINPAAFSGKRVLLIDDVCTTGATLSECAKTLMNAGAYDVICLTLARTSGPDDYSYEYDETLDSDEQVEASSDYDKACSFTGHRPQNLRCGFDEQHPDCLEIKRLLRLQIEHMIKENGVTVFRSGMALGVDMWAAEIVLELKKRYPHIELDCVLPFDEQTAVWSESQQKRHDEIKAKGDYIHITSTEVYSENQRNAFAVRNKYLVDNSRFLIAVWNGLPSGTGSTVKYAGRKGREIVVISPIDFSVKHQEEKTLV